MAFPWGPIISATGAVAGARISAREARRHNEANSVEGRIQQGLKYGINPLVSIGASPAGYAGGAAGGGIAAAGDTIGRWFTARKQRSQEMDAAEAAQWNQHRYNIAEIHQRALEERRTLRLEHELRGTPGEQLRSRMEAERGFSREHRRDIGDLMRDFAEFWKLDDLPYRRPGRGGL